MWFTGGYPHLFQPPLGPQAHRLLPLRHSYDQYMPLWFLEGSGCCRRSCIEPKLPNGPYISGVLAEDPAILPSYRGKLPHASRCYHTFTPVLTLIYEPGLLQTLLARLVRITGFGYPTSETTYKKNIITSMQPGEAFEMLYNMGKHLQGDSGQGQRIYFALPLESYLFTNRGPTCRERATVQQSGFEKPCSITKALTP